MAQKNKSPTLSMLLSYIAPGLGLVYVGRLLAGLVVHVLFLLITLLFVIAVTLFQFFPLYSGLVLVTTLLVFSSLAAWRSSEIIHSGEADGTGSYHHPLIYALIALLTFLAPLAMTAHFSSRHLFTVIPVEHQAMAPQAHRGDHLLVDRTVYRNAPPQRGDLVAVRHPTSGDLSILRVVGVPTDAVEMHGFTVALDDELADYSPLTPGGVASAPLDTLADARLWIEQIYDRRYVISISPGANPEIRFPRVTLGDDQYFVLSDNRGGVADDEGTIETDSRFFGPVSGDHIAGRPLYVAWSSSPESGTTRWNRIGLPTH